jgi:hypothetical protein
MNLKYSAHALDKHSKDKWNAATIRELLESGRLVQYGVFPGQTSDCHCGYAPDGEYVGLVISKEKDGVRVIVTGFASPKEYWKSV